MNIEQAINNLVAKCSFTAYLPESEVRRAAELYVTDAVARGKFSNDSFDLGHMMVLLVPSFTPWFSTDDGMSSIGGQPATRENCAQFFSTSNADSRRAERLQAADEFGPAMSELMRAM